MTKALSTVHMNLPIGSLDAYISRAYSTPILTAQEEFELAEKLYKNNDLNAARQLIIAHLRYVVQVAKSYSGYGLPLNDLIQEGNIGLMKAVKKFNPNMGARLVSFAVHWIKAEIHEFVIKNWRIVKIATTKAQRKLFFNIRKYKKRLGWFTKEEIATVANDLKVRPSDVLHMENRLNAMEISYDGSMNDSDETPSSAPVLYLEAKGYEPSYIIEQKQNEKIGKLHLQEALQKLDARSKDIIRNRWLNDKKLTLQELAVQHSVSIERIRQIEKSAMQKLKAHIDIN